jgi:hypothetical protein
VPPCEDVRCLVGSHDIRAEVREVLLSLLRPREIDPSVTSVTFIDNLKH